MTFVARMAVREIKASWKRLLFFFLCVAIGVAAIVALRSVVQTVRGALQDQARALLAADVVVQTNRPWDDQTLTKVDERLAEARVAARTELIETTTMVRPADPAKGGVRMVELQGISPGFPLHGAVVLQDGVRFRHELLADRGALVRPELLVQLDLRVGDRLLIGDTSFTIRGVVASEPGRRVGAFSFGGRVLVDRAELLGTGLLSLGSRARYAIMLRVPDDSMEQLVRTLRRDFPQQYVSVRSYRGTEDQIGEELQRAENYLSLVGFVVLVLGGIGVWSVTRVFVHQKVRSIAVMKCLGASSAQVLAVYVTQVAALSMAGSLLGVALARLALLAIPSRWLDGLGGVTPSLTTSAVLQGVGVGLLVSLLFALVPLLETRRVKPLLLLRDQVTAAPPSPAERRRLRERVVGRLRGTDWTKVATAFGVGLALALVAGWQAGSLRVGLLVSVGFLAVALVLGLAATGLVRAVRPLRRVRVFPVRHAAISVQRPGGQTRVILIAVGLGAFLILGVKALERNLLNEFSIEARANGPDLFLIDVQPDQAEPLARFLEGAGLQSPARLLPVLRARVTGVKGRDVSLESFDDVRSRGSLAREYVVTFRDRLEPNETIVDGQFWTAAPATDVEVSIERSIRDRFRIAIGDRIRFDILGRVIEARVTSVREVEWADTRAGGFMFVFRPGALDQAPRTYIAIARGPGDAAERARLQRAAVDRFPNVSIIDAREIAKTVEEVLGNVTMAVSVVGAVAVFSGALILIGSVAMTKFERLHEAAVFKTLGAGTRTIAATMALEYGTLGLLAGAIGGLASVALSWVVASRVLDIRWDPSALYVAAGVVITALTVTVVGVVASVDVLRRKPLSVLRAE